MKNQEYEKPRDALDFINAFARAMGFALAVGALGWLTVVALGWEAL